MLHSMHWFQQRHYASKNIQSITSSRREHQGYEGRWLPQHSKADDRDCSLVEGYWTWLLLSGHMTHLCVTDNLQLRLKLFVPLPQLGQRVSVGLFHLQSVLCLVPFLLQGLHRTQMRLKVGQAWSAIHNFGVFDSMLAYWICICLLNIYGSHWIGMGCGAHAGMPSNTRGDMMTLKGSVTFGKDARRQW